MIIKSAVLEKNVETANYAVYTFDGNGMVINVKVDKKNFDKRIRVLELSFPENKKGKHNG